MICKIQECARHNDCGYLEIFKKEPVSKDKCSYFQTDSSLEKKVKKEEEKNKLPTKKPKTSFSPRKKEK
jgi:hypothetical protein